LRANHLRHLPTGLQELPHLEKLDLRWNKLAEIPSWLPHLEERGCVIFI
jgi:Leucine-rich repeat (LRR) protein